MVEKLSKRPFLSITNNSTDNKGFVPKHNHIHMGENCIGQQIKSSHITFRSNEPGSSFHFKGRGTDQDSRVLYSAAVAPLIQSTSDGLIQANHCKLTLNCESGQENNAKLSWYAINYTAITIYSSMQITLSKLYMHYIRNICSKHHEKLAVFIVDVIRNKEMCYL